MWRRLSPYVTCISIYELVLDIFVQSFVACIILPSYWDPMGKPAIMKHETVQGLSGDSGALSRYFSLIFKQNFALHYHNCFCVSTLIILPVTYTFRDWGFDQKVLIVS